MRLRPEIVLLTCTLALFAAMAFCHVAAGEDTRTPGARVVEHRFRIPKASAVRLQFFKPDPSEVALGERLFLETRFAQFFFAHSRGDANTTLSEGDPVLSSSQTIESHNFP